MATLKQSETGQVVEGVDAETFLRDISDPSFWVIVEENAPVAEEVVAEVVEPAIESAEGVFGSSIASHPEVQAAQAADTAEFQAAISEAQQ